MVEVSGREGRRSGVEWTVLVFEDDVGQPEGGVKRTLIVLCDIYEKTRYMHTIGFLTGLKSPN